MNPQELQDRIKKFSYRIVALVQKLPSDFIAEAIAKQLIRFVFSVSANYRASCRAQSKKSFISKLSIVVEEIDESLFWIETINDLSFFKKGKLHSLIVEAIELTKILSSSRKTAQLNSIIK